MGLRCQETRRPTSDVEVATPLARDSDPSLARRSSNHDHIGRFNLVPQLVHCPLSTILLNSIHSMHPSQCSFDSCSIFATLESFNLFLIVSSFVSYRFNCKLDYFSFLGFLVHRPRTAQNSSTFDLPSACVNMSAGFDSVATFTTRKCFAATRSCCIASSSVYDECSCQLLFAKQLPSRSMSLYAMRVVASGSSRQPSLADPILILCLQPNRCPRALPGVLQCFSRHSFQVPRHSFQLRHVTCFR